mmetsp:Transcript_43746/g.105515  ORF Transcript_43746/g.105515 Transcript_43746/m.105515 type:complete len:149 (+) Transcript_43746:193-639(+)
MIHNRIEFSIDRFDFLHHRFLTLNLALVTPTLLTLLHIFDNFHNQGFLTTASRGNGAKCRGKAYTATAIRFANVPKFTIWHICRALPAAGSEVSVDVMVNNNMVRITKMKQNSSEYCLEYLTYVSVLTTSSGPNSRILLYGMVQSEKP